MPTEIFNDLNIEKRNRIIYAAISEFSLHGYTGSSTNRIVRDSRISKGSLFQYFENKEDLYFYILDLVLMEYTAFFKEQIGTLSNDLFTRAIDIAELEFNWFIQNQEKYIIIVEAFTSNNNEINQKIELRYGSHREHIFNQLLEDVSFKRFKWDKSKVINILKWLLQGYKDDFVENLAREKEFDIEKMKKEYVEKLKEYFVILEKGLLG